MNTTEPSRPGHGPSAVPSWWWLAILVLATNLSAQTPDLDRAAPAQETRDDKEVERPARPAPKPAVAPRPARRAVWHLTFNLVRGPTTDRMVRDRIALAADARGTTRSDSRRSGFDGPYELLVADGCEHHARLARAISTRLHAAGIGVRVRKADATGYRRRLAAGDYDLALGRSHHEPSEGWTVLASHIPSPRKSQATDRPASLSSTLFTLATLRAEARGKSGPALRRLLDRKIRDLIRREVLMVVLPSRP